MEHFQHLEDSSWSYRCIKPASVDAKNVAAVEAMLSSHKWVPESTKAQGETGIYFAYICQRCGAERIESVHWIPR